VTRPTQIVCEPDNPTEFLSQPHPVAVVIAGKYPRSVVDGFILPKVKMPANDCDFLLPTAM
jgi:hypothetical protein